MPLITRVSLLFPRVAVVVIAKRLPEPGLVFRDEFEAAHPFGAFPKLEMRDQQTHRTPVLRRERLFIVFVHNPRFTALNVAER